MRWPFTRTATIATDVVPKETSDSSSARFAFRLFRQLCEHKTTANMFFSPGSVALCVAQVKELASGETRRQISNALEISALDQREIEMEIATLKAAFGNRSGAQMSFANALWLGQHVEISAEMKKRLRDLYSSELSSIDFSAPDAVATINAWVSTHTTGKIRNIVNTLSPLAAIVATNAVYFKSRWNVPFQKELTFENPFFTGSNNSKRVPLMTQSGFYPYHENGEIQIVMLPYTGSASMIIVLPAAGTDTGQFCRRLDSGRFESWLKKVKSSEGMIRLPRFKIDVNTSLSDGLKALGMTRAFDHDLAEFEHLRTDRAPVWLDQVSHRALIDVNEEGTEAAAATVAMMPLCSPMHQRPRRMFQMIVNRPFVLAMRDDQTKTILFLGWIGDPS